MLLSNNKEPRVKMFNDAVNVSYIYKAGKPNPANYKKAMEELGTDTGNTIFVGDQIFTDVYGAKRAFSFEHTVMHCIWCVVLDFYLICKSNSQDFTVKQNMISHCHILYPVHKRIPAIV